MSPWYPRIDEVRSSGWSGAESQAPSHPRWRTSATCSHMNSDACPTCDFDRYYARTYPDCPWGPHDIPPHDALDYGGFPDAQ